MGASLPISDLVNVQVNLSPPAAQQQNISTLLILGNSAVIDTVQRLRNYTSLAQVATDFGTTAPEYLAAALWFEQVPQPSTLSIGRWAQTASHGELVGATLSTANQTVSAWTGITAGSLHIGVDGASAVDITGINLSGATTMQGVAALIQTAIDVSFAGTTVVWNATYGRFEITSPTTGATSAVSFLTAAATGTDISAQMGCRSTSSGAYVVPGLALETAATAAALFDSMFGQSWYALVMPTISSDSDHLAVSAYIEGANTKHLYGVTTQEAGVLVASDTTNIAYQLQQLKRLRSIVQYSSSSLYAVCSLFGRILTVNYLGNNTTITLMYKQEPGIVAETLNETQKNALLGFNCNVFVAYNNNTAIIQAGTVANGNFIDVVTGTDWLAIDIQTTLFNLLYTSQTKIPQTDAGTNQLVTAIESVCSQAVANGLLAPGTWTVGGFGNLTTGQFLPKGFYVYAPSISSQSPSQRAARVSVPIQVAAKLAGAIQTVNVIINVNS
jgi:hypothetical protein